jgi:hypothetical protein
MRPTDPDRLVPRSDTAGAPAVTTTQEALAPSAAGPALRGEGAMAGGFRTSTEQPTLQPFAAPLVSAPFAFQRPMMAGEDSAVTMSPLPSVAKVFDAVTTAPAGQGAPLGVPGALTATATGLLLLLGAGHLLHRTGRLQRTFIK